LALDGLIRTLLFTLRARAEEHARPDAILTDPLAAAWYARLDPAPDARAALAAAYSPIFQVGTAVRARLYDRLTADFLASHPRGWVVELGAGLSTRYYRLGRPSTPWIELDLPPAIELRRTFETETAVHRCLPCSMLNPAWPARLPPHVPQDLLLLAEGVLFFLDPAEIRALFALLGRHFPGATVALDYLTPRFSPKARALFASVDAPMRWLVTDAAAELAALGLYVHDRQVVTHHFLPRWEALGFPRQHLLAGEGNVVIRGSIEAGVLR
jgi:O-methyltransferase involved in polyketide biosynthesis